MNRSEFKDRLQGVIDEELIIEGAFGNLVLQHEADQRAVMFAGGIGITPFRSMIMSAADKKFPISALLFHANRCYGDEVFQHDILSAGKNLKEFVYVPVFSREETQNKEHRRISPDLIRRYGANRSNDTYYITGSPGFVSTTRRMLIAEGIAKERIRIEEFPGY
jgi:ferredoxin-NADP reductase